jgi:hypothetical protein
VEDRPGRWIVAVYRSILLQMDGKRRGLKDMSRFADSNGELADWWDGYFHEIVCL